MVLNVCLILIVYDDDDVDGAIVFCDDFDQYLTSWLMMFHQQLLLDRHLISKIRDLRLHHYHFFCVDDLTGVEGPRLGDVEILPFSLSDIGERERDNDDEDECKRVVLVSISRYQIDIDGKNRVDSKKIKNILLFLFQR